MIGRSASIALNELRARWGSVDNLLLRGITSLPSALIDILAPRRYDLIIAQEPLAAVGLTGLLASMIKRAPLVTEVHGDYMWSGSLRVIDRVVAPLVLRRSRLVRAVSKSIERKLRWLGNVAFIPAIYVDARVFKPLTPPEQREPIVLYAGRLSREKRIELLLDGFAEALGSVNGMRLRIIGMGPELPNILKKIEERGISEHVTVLNKWLEPKGVALEYAAASVNVCTSLYEGGPRTIFEAAACLTPSISTRVGLAAEVFKHNESIFFLDDPSPRSLAEGLRLFLHDSSLRGRIARRAREIVLQSYEWSRAIERYAGAYIELSRRSS